MEKIVQKSGKMKQVTEKTHSHLSLQIDKNCTGVEKGNEYEK